MIAKRLARQSYCFRNGIRRNVAAPPFHDRFPSNAPSHLFHDVSHQDSSPSERRLAMADLGSATMYRPIMRLAIWCCLRFATVSTSSTIIAASTTIGPSDAARLTDESVCPPRCASACVLWAGASACNRSFHTGDKIAGATLFRVGVGGGVVGFQRFGFVGELPREGVFRAAEMAEGGGLAVDRAAELQVVDDGARGQVEFARTRSVNLSSGIAPVPKVSTDTDTGSATPMA